MKRSILIIILCLFLVGIFATTYHMQTVGADSGFDSGYDSGGSDSSGGGGEGIVYLIYLCIEYPALGFLVLAVLAFLIISNKKKTKEIMNKALNNNVLELLDVNKYDASKKLEIEIYNIYKKIQYAWMNFDEEAMRTLTTDEMYNMYLMQMDTLKAKHQKNIMYDINYVSSSIKKQYEENGQDTILVQMKVTCYDFIIDTRTNKAVRGFPSKLNHYTYELTFVRTKETSSIKNCPQCGAPVDSNNSGVCEYCKSTLVSGDYTLVMSKKKMISQQ